MQAEGVGVKASKEAAAKHTELQEWHTTLLHESILPLSGLLQVGSHARFTCAHFQDSPNVFLCSALQVVKAILSSHVCSCCAGGLTLACVCTQPMYMQTNRMSIRYILQHTWAYAWGQEPTLTASIKVDCVNQSCQRQR